MNPAAPVTNIFIILKKLDEGGVDFDGGGDEAGELDDEAAFTHAFHGEEASFVPIEHAAHDAHFPAAHGGGDLAGPVKQRLPDAADGADEPLHVVVAHGHRLVYRPAVDVAVLKVGIFLDERVDGRFSLVDEEKVLYHGYVALLLASADGHDHAGHGSEYFQTGVGQLVDGEPVGVSALKVAHHEPLLCGRIHIFTKEPVCRVAGMPRPIFKPENQRDLRSAVDALVL